jgi:type VI secretion system secreted protein Hcp
MILMNFEGITGESTVRGYEGCLDVLSFSWAVSRVIQILPGSSSDRTKPTVGEFVITRSADGCSARLLNEVLHGEANRVVKVSFVRTGGEQPTDFMRYEFEDCGVSAFSTSNGGDGPIEQLSIAFRRVTFLAFAIDNTLRAPPDSTSYDLVTGDR